ncbi:MAG: hypothetical protein U0350_02060 [Caldilineaceae bacterium]
METEDTQTTTNERVGCLQLFVMVIVFLLALGYHQNDAEEDADSNTGEAV